MSDQRARWKLDPVLRGQGPGSEPQAITVETAPDLDDGTRQALTSFGLLASGGQRTWRGLATPDQIADIADLDGVTYLSSDSATEMPSERPAKRYEPPKPAKRGHTKLPPRRD